MRRTFTKHWAYKYICLSTNCQFWFISYYVFKIIKHQKCKMCLQCVEITSMYCKWFVLHPVAVFHHHHNHRRRFQVIFFSVVGSRLQGFDNDHNYWSTFLHKSDLQIYNISEMNFILCLQFDQYSIWDVNCHFHWIIK